MLVRITESTELPITTGIIEVDSSAGSITIFMRPAPPHQNNESLTITKVSQDGNSIALFSDTVLINQAEIVMFGLPTYARFKKGKIRTLILQSDGTNWNIIREI
jgi:hypothetical protein